MKQQTVHLGFEVGTGAPVEIPIAHLCVTGQTQMSGKTTTLEALVSRSGRQAIAFITKRGEGAFSLLTQARADLLRGIPPFFKHRADWQFVSDILGAVLSEKLKFQRSWIMKVCRGAKTLRDVHQNVKTQLTKKLRGLDESVYTELDAYFDLLLPEIEALPYSEKLELGDGLNVMDLSVYTTPLQMLVISSVLSEIYKNFKDVITVIPEAWEFVPRSRSSPVKSAAITLARKGAVLRNYLFIDSQDLAGLDVEVRQACTVWILGVQREQNEVKRLLAHIPGGTKKPKVDDIMHLEKGQFFVCHGREVRKVYVQPAWVTDETAIRIAIGKDRVQNYPKVTFPMVGEGQDSWRLAVPTRDFGKVGAFHEVPPAAFNNPDLNLANEVSSGDPIVYLDQNSYNQPPKDARHFIDDGGKTVDQQERDRYETTITDLKAQLQSLREQLSRLTYANGPKGPPAALREMPPAPSHLPDIEVLYSALADRVFADPRMAQAGTVQVEPREVVLKHFQREEVGRMLAKVEARSPFQKQLIAYLEARGTGVKKGTAVTAVTGKRFMNMARDCDAEYQEIRELAALGFIREDANNSMVYANLAASVKRNVDAFEPTDKDIADIIGQIMLRLK